MAAGTVTNVLSSQTTNKSDGTVVQAEGTRMVLFIHGDSVFDGASVVLMCCSDGNEDTAAKFTQAAVGNSGQVKRTAEPIVSEMATGMHYRADVVNAGPLTSITADLIQG